VQDQRLRMNFPSRHPLYAPPANDPITETVRDADVVLGLEAQEMWTITHKMTGLNTFGMESSSTMKPGAKIISISAIELNHKSNYQDFGRYSEVDLSITGDAEATLPSLIEAVKKQMTSDRRIALQARGAKLAEANRKARERNLEAAAVGFDASPIATARLAAELWAQIKNEDWSLVSSYYTSDLGGWPRRLWNFDKPYQWLGHAGGGGIGYGAPASVGGALANKKHGRLSVAIQTDGDLMYAPGVLWTAAHHRIPLLSVMNNNRAYHMELMHVQRMCNARNRSVDRGAIGSQITDPNVDYAKLAASMGVYAEGPIDKPADLAPALRRAIAVVKRGEPAVVDVVTQVR